ncbi:MAG: arylmalonate decarboxylase [Alphaproteobacteria bacterium]|nr:arylmalonate decarboxylase [Alphaproteobacteria bacterium]
MPDSLGHRLKIGVVVPSTNTIVQPEFAAMQPPGVTNHVSRIAIPDVKLGTDNDFVAHIERMRAGIDIALERVMTCSPDYVVNGLSLEAFWEGLQGSLDMLERLEEKFSIKISMGNNAILAALKLVGEIKTIALITPHKPLGDERVRRFFNEAGYEVTDLHSFNVNMPAEICHVGEDALREATLKVNQSNPDAIVQVGTGLANARVAGEAWHWLKKPVIAINTACYWHALRQCGIDDKVPGYGPLLLDY